MATFYCFNYLYQSQITHEIAPITKTVLTMQTKSHLTDVYIRPTTAHDAKNLIQRSNRSSIVKFPDFSSHGTTISLTLSKQ